MLLMIGRVDHLDVFGLGQVQLQVPVSILLNDHKPIRVFWHIRLDEVFIQRQQLVNDMLVQYADTRLAHRTLLKTLKPIPTHTHKAMHRHVIDPILVYVLTVDSNRLIVHTLVRLLGRIPLEG